MSKQDCRLFLQRKLFVSGGDRLLEIIESRDRLSAPIAIDFCNTHVLCLSHYSRGFSERYSDVDLRVVDGFPLYRIMKFQWEDIHLCRGPDFFKKVLFDSTTKSSHYIIGGSAKHCNAIKEKLAKENSGSRVVGAFVDVVAVDGTLSREQEKVVLSEIQSTQPDYVWIGLGTPKQQLLAVSLKNKINCKAILTVGYALDVVAGHKKDAHPLLIGLGMGWVHRLCQDPKRLFFRYLKYNALFAFLLVSCGIRGKLFDEA